MLQYIINLTVLNWPITIQLSRESGCSVTTNRKTPIKGRSRWIYNKWKW